MNIYTFTATDPDSPVGAIARIWLGPGKKLGWHPVIFTSDTSEAARAKAQAWWDTESAKVDKRKAPRRKKDQAEPQQTVADPGDVI